MTNPYKDVNTFYERIIHATDLSTIIHPLSIAIFEQDKFNSIFEANTSIHFLSETGVTVRIFSQHTVLIQFLHISIINPNVNHNH